VKKFKINHVIEFQNFIRVSAHKNREFLALQDKVKGEYCELIDDTKARRKLVIVLRNYFLVVFTRSNFS